MTNAEEGAKITEMDATDLVGRLVINPHGVEYVVTRLSFDSRSASVIIWIAELEEESGRIGQWGDTEAGLMDLQGWSIHHKLRKEET